MIVVLGLLMAFILGVLTGVTVLSVIAYAANQTSAKGR